MIPTGHRKLQPKLACSSSVAVVACGVSVLISSFCETSREVKAQATVSVTLKKQYCNTPIAGCGKAADVACPAPTTCLTVGALCGNRVRGTRISDCGASFRWCRCTRFTGTKACKETATCKCTQDLLGINWYCEIPWFATWTSTVAVANWCE